MRFLIDLYARIIKGERYFLSVCRCTAKNYDGIFTVTENTTTYGGRYLNREQLILSNLDFIKKNNPEIHNVRLEVSFITEVSKSDFLDYKLKQEGDL
jgi:hypothetical protein